jgi:pimeloyl-ACP methyl ester carboxylesterase
MVTKGTGFPVVVIPGINGRWEWFEPTVDALTAGHRVVSFSLNEMRPNRERQGSFLAWMRAMDEMLDRAHERKVSLIGVSFGGLIAACYAARRPERVSALVLASTPAPAWTPRPADAFCVRYPRIGFPYFAARSLPRLGPEIYRARDSWSKRMEFAAQYARRAISAPFSPVHAAQWIREWQAFDITEDCGRITAPTLVVTGEPELDKVVAVGGTMQYIRLIAGATHAVLPGTGHIGVITKPHRFAEIAGQFIYAARSADRNAKPAPAEERARHAS